MLENTSSYLANTGSFKHSCKDVFYAVTQGCQIMRIKLLSRPLSRCLFNLSKSLQVGGKTRYYAVISDTLKCIPTCSWLIYHFGWLVRNMRHEWNNPLLMFGLFNGTEVGMRLSNMICFIISLCNGILRTDLICFYYEKVDMEISTFFHSFFYMAGKVLYIV